MPITKTDLFCPYCLTPLFINDNPKYPNAFCNGRLSHGDYCDYTADNDKRAPLSEIDVMHVKINELEANIKNTIQTKEKLQEELKNVRNRIINHKGPNIS